MQTVELLGKAVLSYCSICHDKAQHDTRHIRLAKDATVLHMLAHLNAASNDSLLQYPRGRQQVTCFTSAITLSIVM